MIIESLLTATVAVCCSNVAPVAEQCACEAYNSVDTWVESETEPEYSEEYFEPAVDYAPVYTDTSNAAYWDEVSLPAFKDYVSLDMYDLNALYNCVEHEVGGCSQRSKYIVTASILNRCIDGWETTVYNVITAPNQYQDIFDVLYLEDYATQDTIDCVNYVLYSGIDFANGATSFYNRDICGWIDWFEEQNLVAELDGHRYFKLW